MQRERMALPAPPSGLRAGLRALYHRLPAPPSTTYAMPGHEHPSPFDGLPAGITIYDIGAKRVRGYAVPAGARVITVDIDPAAGTDIVADAHSLHMIADEAADCVYCSDVLEHCERPWVVIRELHRILKPGGRIFLSIPFMFPYHADPHDHWRASYTGIDHLCRGLFRKIGSGYQRGPASCMAHLNIHFLALLLSFNSKAIYGVLVDLGKWAFAWTKVLDRLLAKHPMRHVIHAGVWYLGEKV